jgi:Carboxypeptidase regulatory-like domain
VKPLIFPRIVSTTRLLTCIGAFVLLLLIPFRASGQDVSVISGTVTDKSGAAVVGAKVVITNAGGNLTRTTETNSEGVYVVPALPSGSYDVSVTSKGFQRFQVKAVVLEVAQKSRVDITLTVGAVTEEVIVTGESVAQVDTQSAELGTTITGKQVQQLELNGRNFTQLVTLAPGVVNQTGQDEGLVGVAGNVGYSINGGRTEYNTWELDGGDNMDNGSNSTLNVYPNLEAIAEFKVLTSNYGAQYGRNGSGTVEVETKSGTSSFHGSAFEYLRNQVFNANSWENNGQGVARPDYKKNDFGYTFGGPIFIPHHYNTDKKKTFFFWSQEWRREIVPGGTISQNVPSDAERTGNFNDVCPVYTGASFDPTAYPDCPSQPLNPGTPFVNNTLPATTSTTVPALLSMIPKANNTLGVYGSGQASGSPLPAYIANPSYPTNWREELIRVDQNFSENERLTVRYIHDSWSTINQGPLWGVYNNTFDNTNTNFVGPATSFVVRLTSTIKPNLLNEFVASYTADHIILSNITNVSLPSGGIDLLPLFPAQFTQANKIPAISVGNTNGTVYGTGGFGVDTGYFPWKNANPTYTYRDIMTYIHGNHTMLFGGYVVFAQKNEQSTADIQGQLAFDTANPNSTGNPFADLQIAQMSAYAQTSAQPYFYNRYKIFEPFFQDDWRVTRKLTLNLGLRWSFFGRYQEKQFKEFNFSPTTYVPLNGPALYPFTDPINQQLLLPTTNPFNGFEQCGAINQSYPGIAMGITGCMKNKYMNPGPRIGIAYDPGGNGKWAIRAGYGIFFEHMNGNEANTESLEGNPSPLVQNGSVGSQTGYPIVGFGSQSAPSPFSATSIPGQVQWPYMQQWNLSVEHELPAHIVTSLAYVGSKGTHLTSQYDLNQLQPVPASQNPFLASGAPITSADCSGFGPQDPAINQGLPTSATLGNGTNIAGQAVTNLFVACGNPAAAYSRPYAGLGSITRLSNPANSSYNALQATARRTMGDLTFSASYAWSHSIDDSSDRYDGSFPNSYDPRLTRASSNFDIRQSFSLSYVYAFPFYKHDSGWKHTLLGGWQWSGITVALTGAPFSVANGTQYSDNAGLANGAGYQVVPSFPDVVGNPNTVPAAVQQSFQASGFFGKLLYNPTAFTLPVGLTIGNAERNMLRMPGRLNFDMGLMKRFEFKERYAFEFRWETFNTFNHTQLNSFSGTNPGGNAGQGGNIAMGCDPVAAQSSGGDPTCGGFLVLNGSHLPRIMQFGLRFQF